MWDNLIVAVILVIAACICLRGLIKTFKGQGGCGGSCACKGRSKGVRSSMGDKKSTGHPIHDADVVQLGDLRDRSRE